MMKLMQLLMFSTYLKRLILGILVRLIHAATGQDITMPPPNAQGKVIFDQEGIRLIKVS